ncbi:flagellar protein FliT [Paraburkholderia phosphatilytica]|uniref:flagellar protein FliT n=1 Tax=Paraburkholderia phosphatilytica TaxID=2282883 RepID=UPI000E4A2FDC|nr:flagellar protein FliT [Paraburkholderia phosphatilytica]
MHNPSDIHDQRDVIARVHALTSEIRVAANTADWALAARLADERSPLVMSLRAPVDSAALALIREIQAMDADLLVSADGARNQLVQQQNQSIQKISATNQYNRVALF